MFGIGFSELVLIGLVVVVFIRPEDLPSFFRKLGKIYREIKKAYDELTKVKDDFIKDFEASIPSDEPKISGPENLPGQDSPEPEKPETPPTEASSSRASASEDAEGNPPRPRLNFSKTRPLATEGVPAAAPDDGSGSPTPQTETGDTPKNS